MGRVKIVLIVIGLGALFFGGMEWQLKTVAKDTPQRISAAELEARGPGDNANIILTDFLLCEQAFVYEYKQSRGGGGERWSKVWIPAVPLNGPYHRQILSMLGPNGEIPPNLPNPQDIRIIVKSTDARNEADVSAMAAADTLEGVVTNKIESLGGEEKRRLAESYPGTDFTKCWIIHKGRKPMSAGAVLGLMGGGGFAALLGIALIVNDRRKSS